MVKRINPFEGAAMTMSRIYESVITGKELEHRKDVFNDVIGDITIDTCKGFDIGMWETGIERKSIEGKWIIVEQYTNREKAEAGHKVWVDKLTKNPNIELTDIDLWGLKGEED